MPVVLYIVAALELLGGVVTVATSLSAIHEILGALMLGFGFMTMALGGILSELKRGRQSRENST